MILGTAFKWQLLLPTASLLNVYLMLFGLCSPRIYVVLFRTEEPRHPSIKLEHLDPEYQESRPQQNGTSVNVQEETQRLNQNTQ